MALSSQVLDHFRWFSNPLRFNVFAPLSMGVREGKQRVLGQVRSNLLPLQLREKGETGGTSETRGFEVRGFRNFEP